MNMRSKEGKISERRGSDPCKWGRNTVPMTGAQDDSVHQDLREVDDLHTHTHTDAHMHAHTRNDEYEVDLSCHTMNLLFPAFRYCCANTPCTEKCVCVTSDLMPARSLGTVSTDLLCIQGRETPITFRIFRIV